MNSRELPLDDLIRLAGRDAARSIAADWQREDDSDLWFSPAFEAKMDALTHRSERRFRRLRVLSTALVAAAILALLAATAMAVPTVREAIIRTWITWTGRSADFRYSGFASEDSDYAASYEPKYIPEGFVETERVESDNSIVILYTKLEDGDKDILFSNSIATDSLISVDSEHTVHSEIAINNYPADLFTAQTEDDWTVIVLQIENRVLVIRSFEPVTELIKMLESMF